MVATSLTILGFTGATAAGLYAFFGVTVLVAATVGTGDDVEVATGGALVTGEGVGVGVGLLEISGSGATVGVGTGVSVGVGVGADAGALTHPSSANDKGAISSNCNTVINWNCKVLV